MTTYHQSGRGSVIRNSELSSGKRPIQLTNNPNDYVFVSDRAATMIAIPWSLSARLRQLHRLIITTNFIERLSFPKLLEINV